MLILFLCAFSLLAGFIDSVVGGGGHLGLIHQPKHAPKKAQLLGILIGAGLGFYDGFFGPVS
jgi:uncharacterized membrane protein YfcA